MAADEQMTMAEMLAARRRFEQDQDDADHAEYTLAKGRIGTSRGRRRDRERLLRANGCTVA